MYLMTYYFYLVVSTVVLSRLRKKNCSVTFSCLSCLNFGLFVLFVLH
uniref:Uncharacterized protein n=1 Tax=Arundo donax TaxID=35708 RepID=A0A0A9B4M4_ARUDO